MPVMFASFLDLPLISRLTKTMESDEESEIQLFSAASTSRKLKSSEKPDCESPEKRRKTVGKSPECEDGEEECGNENSNLESEGKKCDRVEEKEKVDSEGASRDESPAEENDQNDSQLSLKQLGLNSWLVRL